MENNWGNNVSVPLQLALSPAAEPVLRWAGSKRRVTPLLYDHAPTSFDRYIEPFAGSGALFFHLQPNSAILGDLNPEVTATYEAIKCDAALVSDLLEGIPRTKEAYLQLRQLDPGSLTLSQRAARLIFLMKGSFNGVYRTNRLGQFNVPFGTRVYRLPSRDDLARVAQLLSTTTIKTGSYRDWVVDIAQGGDFVYLDPPYSSSVRFRGEYGYAAAFRDAEIGPLLDVCHKLDQKKVQVMLSYKVNNYVETFLANWTICKVNVPRTVGGLAWSRGSAAEMLAVNY